MATDRPAPSPSPEALAAAAEAREARTRVETVLEPRSQKVALETRRVIARNGFIDLALTILGGA